MVVLPAFMMFFIPISNTQGARSRPGFSSPSPNIPSTHWGLAWLALSDMVWNFTYLVFDTHRCQCFCWNQTHFLYKQEVSASCSRPSVPSLMTKSWRCDSRPCITGHQSSLPADTIANSGCIRNLQCWLIVKWHTPLCQTSLSHTQHLATLPIRRGDLVFL